MLSISWVFPPTHFMNGFAFIVIFIFFLANLPFYFQFAVCCLRAFSQLAPNGRVYVP
jgi:hypothetical protein